MSIQTVGVYRILLSYMLLFRPRYYTFLYISRPNLLHHDAMQPVISFTAPTPPDLKPTVHSSLMRCCSTWYVNSIMHSSMHLSHPYTTRIIQGGTLTDSIVAVEAAWSKVAREIGADPAFVIAATHGKRAIDNLVCFKPHLRSHEMKAAMEEFERSILFYLMHILVAARHALPHHHYHPAPIPTPTHALAPALALGTAWRVIR